MTRFDTLVQKVKDLYEAKDPNRDTWADWLYANHVFVVADNAKRIAEAKGADPELSQVAALLHDIADVKMARVAENHEEESLAIGRQVMSSSGYSDEEIALVVDDAVKWHSCHDGKHPESLEGRVLATADALAHFNTDFYAFATWAMGADGRPLDYVKGWALKKIDRDLNDKISFDDIREETRPNYEMIRKFFSL